MMFKRILCSALIVILGVIGCMSSYSSAAMGSPPKQQIVYKVQTDFIKANKLAKSDIRQTLTYDINNDGSNEIIILGGDLQHSIGSKGYIGVYSKEGKHLATKKYDDSFLPFDLRKVKNATYKNCLGIGELPGASGGSRIQILAFSKGEFMSLVVTDSSENGITIKDVDNDSNDEIIGYEWYLTEETRHLSHVAAIYDKYVYSWDKKKGKYIKQVYGQDGKRDDLRKPVNTLTKSEAIQLLNKASKTLFSGNPLPRFTEFKEKMQFLLTYNFIYRYNSTNSIDVYSIPLSEFDMNKATFKMSPDKQTATVTQKIEIVDADTEEHSFIKITAVLIKTKYGWKIDNVTF
ncbi:hypothetical protein J2TS6_05250 [Paenibacillus albilobatus]|uniref:Uncharacterized protein n=2 Tax=Paenibacillus TaxID=44249 RepID=A0A919XCY9_9BACL|nr:hypothetical protein J2TS6_05250 [Paenibacillus albilobatus]